MSEVIEKGSICPFSGSKCLKEKCALWAGIRGPGGQNTEMCGLVALLLVTATPKPQPTQMPPGLNPQFLRGTGR